MSRGLMTGEKMPDVCRARVHPPALGHLSPSGLLSLRPSDTVEPGLSRRCLSQRIYQVGKRKL